jgi:hypothetical protein
MVILASSSESNPTPSIGYYGRPPAEIELMTINQL